MALDQSKKMVAGKTSHLAGETRASVHKEKLCFAVAPRVEQHIPPGTMTSVVLETDAEIEITQRDPNSLTAPSRMDHFLRVGQQGQESLTGIGSQGRGG